MDLYLEELNKILCECENTMGLSNSVDGLLLRDADIRTVVQYTSNKVLKELNPEQLKSVNNKVGSTIVLLSYISDRLTILNKKRLDFSKYPRLKVITGVLIDFSNFKTKPSIKEVNKIITILDVIDNKNVSFRSSLSYRYLRLFVLLVLYRSYVNAGVVARFILMQQVTRRKK